MSKRKIFDIIIALLAILAMFVLGFLLPLFGTVLLLLLPLPIIILFVKYDIQTALFFILLSSTLLALGISPILFIIMIINIGLIAVVMGAAIKENFSAFKIFLTGFIASFISLMLILAISIYIFDVDIIAILTQNIEDMLAMSELNQLIDDSFLLEDVISETLNFIKSSFPAMFISLALVIAALNYYVATLFLVELKAKNNSFLLIEKFKLPRITLLLFILSIFTIEFIISKNILLIITFLLVIQGVGLLYWYFQNKINFSILIIILAIMTILPMMNPLLLLLGLLDVAFDFRSLANQD